VLFAGQLFGAIIWGWMSDIYGRRSVMLCGLVGTLLFVVAFGLSTTYEAALFCRFMWGLLNGNVGVAKTYTESCCSFPPSKPSLQFPAGTSARSSMIATKPGECPSWASKAASAASQAH